MDESRQRMQKEAGLGARMKYGNIAHLGLREAAGPGCPEELLSHELGLRSGVWTVGANWMKLQEEQADRKTRGWLRSGSGHGLLDKF